MECTTCRMIHLVDKTYPVRPARFGSAYGRCFWHAWEEDSVWQCDACGRFRNAEEVSFCLTHGKCACLPCSASGQRDDSFWLWKHTLLASCPFCSSSHPTLFAQEYAGVHPWQADPFSCRDFPIWYPGGRLIHKDDVGTP